MITVRTPENALFNYAECEELYNKCRKLIEDDEFEKVINRTAFYAFHILQTGELTGCIYFYHNNGDLYLNGFAERGHHELNLECLKEALKWYDCDIYANGLHKTSRLCLLKCGFKRLKNNLFVYRRNNNG